MDASAARAAAEASPLALASGSTVGGAPISTMTSTDAIAAVEGSALTLDAGTTLGGATIATTSDITWGNLAGKPGGFADDIDDERSDAEIVSAIEAGAITLADGSQVGGALTIHGDLEVKDSSGTTVFAIDGASGAVTTSTVFQRPIAFSGYCNTHGQSAGTYLRYCLSNTEYDTSGSHFSVASSGVITVSTPGYYRIDMWAIANVSSSPHMQLLKNGTQFQNGHEYSGNQWEDVHANLMWPFDAGDTFEVRIYSSGGSNYNYHSGNANGSHSRMQFSYVGPL